MAIYQCFFFSQGRISDWENIECDGSIRLSPVLRDRLRNAKWSHVEAWVDDKLVCEIRRGRPVANGPIESALSFSRWAS